MVTDHRKKDNREPETSFLIVDAKSIKTTCYAEERGYDAGKKINGIKLHAGVDTNGLPHCLHITTADVGDRKGITEAIKKENLKTVKNVLADGGYTGKNFEQEIDKIISATVEISKRNELHKFEVIPKRWVVERSFAWLENFRRLWKNAERKINSSLNMYVLAFISILINRL